MLRSNRRMERIRRVLSLRQPGLTTVRLIVAPMSYVPYTVVASGIADNSCFHNVANQTSAEFQGAPVAVDPARLPGNALRLAAPAPNPARGGRAVVEYALPGSAASGAPVSLRIYDTNGRHLRTLVSGPQAAGVYRVPFDGRDDHGSRLAPGIYYLRLVHGAEQQVKRLVVMD